MQEEIWKDVPNYPFYQVSNLGRVRSLDRMELLAHSKSGYRKRKGRILKAITHKGYLVVNLSVESKTRLTGIHQLVALAFIGPPPDGHVVDHVNCDKHDNRPENLEYVTNSENVLRQYRNGLLCNKGETHGGSKLTNAQVAEIRSLQGRQPKEVLAAKYGVTADHIYAIWTWRTRKSG